MSAVYAVCVGVAAVATGDRIDTSVHITVVIALFILFGYAGYTADEQYVETPSPEQRLRDHKKGEAYITFLLGTPIAFLAGAVVLNGFTYSFQTLSTVGIAIILVVLVITAVLLLGKLIKSSDVPWTMCFSPLFLLMYGPIVNGFLKSLSTLTWPGLILLVLIMGVVSIRQGLRAEFVEWSYGDDGFD